ncbi:hypothetical protein HF846_04275 [Clostridium cadaveris]|uniref:hypothetical protein n=1 Tax=Clostridium cadaveris TaxID=1529 RepID=UPI001459BCF1|nr:hypothetical protein [Clostridium cadaveris]NME63817.1 hypothetical protein [Clostridium cadaveris]
MEIYKIGKCDYCGDKNVVVRSTPFMADRLASMCEYCWNETQKEYASSNEEYIGDFQSNKNEYDKILNLKTDSSKTLTVGELKEFLSDSKLPDNAEIFILDKDDIDRSRLIVCDIESDSRTGYYDYLYLTAEEK